MLHTQEDVYEGAHDPVFRAVTVEFEVPEWSGKSIRIIRPEDLACALACDQAPDQAVT